MKLQYYEIFLFSNQIIQQVCIPVGCVPAASRPYAGVCFPGGGCLLPGGGVSASGGVSGPRGVVVCFGGGVGLVRGGGVSGLGGSAPGGVVSQHALRQTPPCEQNE